MHVNVMTDDFLEKGLVRTGALLESECGVDEKIKGIVLFIAKEARAFIAWKRLLSAGP